MEASSAFSGPGIRLPAREAGLVRSGIPELPIEELPGARTLPPGAAATLLDRRGRPVGAGIADPSRRVFRVWSHRPVRAFDEGFFRARLEAALARRADLRRREGTDAYRLLHGDGEGLCGLTVDAWGEYLVVTAHGPGPAAWTGILERSLAALLRPRGIIRKHAFAGEGGAGGGARERGKVDEEVVHGEAPPGKLVVHEAGIPFSVRLLGGRHAGLFTDMREERLRLASLSAGRRVLNTFAYTGAFSVAAARGGATEVVSVDAVGKALEWARENFRLSRLDAGRHRFVRADVLEYLDRARRRGWTFGAIVLDPPTFATMKEGRWSLRRDYPRLIAKSLPVLAPGGHLWVCANAAGVPEREVERWIAGAAAAAGRPLETLVRAGQPPDYPAPPGFPRYRYLKIHVLRG